MIQKVQLKHPQGKKSISMSREKYDLLKSRLLKFMRATGQATFNDMLRAIEQDFKASRTTFHGSLPWHLEWIKLDLEARKIIKRIAGASPQRYRISS